ncbi:nuclear cap-binding protein subunit 1-like [Trifolium pratense]|uniref:Nuclear cap-binding protein subunit 1-like n=1 Tax=Trifolium pratense TaxID=57577 RepID=A0A2K3NLH0_TRIPR|nr:nuclear cap-binding protein subunit 1-like [Trifolium pratense]
MCSKALQPSSLVDVFETFLSSAATTVDEEKGNPLWQPCADFYIACILSCLPWGGAELVEQIPEDIERVMVGIEAYLSIRKHTSDNGLSFFENVDEIERDLNNKDFLEDLWDRVQVLSSNGWKVESVPRPHLSFEAQLVAGKSHEFGTINCSNLPTMSSVPSDVSFGKEKHEAELKYPQRIRRLNIFPSSKMEDMQPIDRFVVEEYLLDVLFYFNGSRKECASFMVGLPVTFRYEYLMAETIFSQLLMLPQPPFKPVYYTLVIIDLCKALPGAFPAVVAGAVRALFEKIADLDMECRTRLILWFSHHFFTNQNHFLCPGICLGQKESEILWLKLGGRKFSNGSGDSVMRWLMFILELVFSLERSNFQFIWPWEEWAYVLDLPRWAPQRVFVQEVLEREVRLSYWDKVKQSIENAPGLEELLPPKGGPNFNLGAENGKENNEQLLSGQLNEMVKGKAPVREIISWIEESVFPNNSLEVTLRVVVQTLLNIGSKSFTHLITVLERYGQVISKICPDEDKQIMLIAEVGSFWKSNTQMTAIAIDRMMGYRLVSNLAIVRWVFSEENVEQFHMSDRPWEVLRNAVSKTYNRISDLRKEILSLKRNISSAEVAVNEAKAEVDAAASKLALVDGEPVIGENPAMLNRLKSHAEKAQEELVSIQESVEAKEALLGRATDENEALFLLLFKSFSNVLTDRLPKGSGARSLREWKSAQVEDMAVDPEEPSTMELDNENQIPQNSQSNGGKKNVAYNVGEKEQWCITTLSYVKAFSRQYASEIWAHIEKLDAEVLTEDAPPLFRSAVGFGLRRPVNEA